MTRGNQRDVDKARADKRNSKGKSAADHEANKGLTLEQRKARDAELMRLKQEKKAAAAAGSSKS